MENLDIKDFQSLSGISLTDYVLLAQSSGGNGKILVSLLKSALQQGIKPSIGENGNWHIGNEDTGVLAEVKQLEFRAGEIGIEYRYVGDDEWVIAITYESLSQIDNLSFLKSVSYDSIDTIMTGGIYMVYDSDSQTNDIMFVTYSSENDLTKQTYINTNPNFPIPELAYRVHDGEKWSKWKNICDTTYEDAQRHGYTSNETDFYDSLKKIGRVNSIDSIMIDNLDSLTNPVSTTTYYTVYYQYHVVGVLRCFGNSNSSIVTQIFDANWDIDTDGRLLQNCITARMKSFVRVYNYNSDELVTEIPKKTWGKWVEKSNMISPVASDLTDYENMLVPVFHNIEKKWIFIPLGVTSPDPSGLPYVLPFKLK